MTLPQPPPPPKKKKKKTTSYALIVCSYVLAIVLSIVQLRYLTLAIHVVGLYQKGQLNLAIMVRWKPCSIDILAVPTAIYCCFTFNWQKYKQTSSPGRDRPEAWSWTRPRRCWAGGCPSVAQVSPAPREHTHTHTIDLLKLQLHLCQHYLIYSVVITLPSISPEMYHSQQQSK